ncbi:MAG: orotidine-5'-phosphate decarboxylase [Acidimicrobiia bacterium]
MTFAERLRRAWDQSGSMLCVGLDPEPSRMPAGLRGRPDAILQFTRAIVDATGDLVCAFKPQIAYFAAQRAEEQLEELCAHIRATQPHALLVLDAKRGDIGPTAEQYAIEAFERYGADAVTVNPYLGTDSITPFLEHRDRGVFVLCRTSNPGGSDLQDLDAGGMPLYERVARLVAERWNDHRQCGLVIGATNPAELALVRAAVGDDVPFLVPGVGAQGGDAAETVRRGATAKGDGLVVSSSRAILYASSGEDFAVAARAVAAATVARLAEGR